MITEDYVSFETAKLLKEKGFDEFTISYYYKNGSMGFSEVDTRVSDGYQRPTLQMAMKWLRETHNLGVFLTWTQVFGCYRWRVYYLKKGSQELYSVGANYNTYEEACEAAIKYCLENLI